MRSLKLLLPISGASVIAAYAATTWQLMALNNTGIQSAGVRISTENLVMDSPSYDGWAEDGSRYVVRARSAKTDLAMQGPVRLDAIEADLEQPSGVKTRLTSVWGTFDQKKNELELYERIDIDATNGMKARLTRATVLVKESRVTTDEPLTFQSDTARVAAKSMVLLTKDRKANFRGGVVVDLTPSNATAAGGAKEAAKRTAGAPIPGLSGQSGEPIKVTSATLDVDDGAHTATFREHVVARQGESQLEAPQMVVAYQGDTTATQPAEGSAARLKSITATGGIIMTRGGDRVTSDDLVHDATGEQTRLSGPVRITSGSDRVVTSRKADIDHKADRISLSGSVVVVQGKNILKGEQLAIDRPIGRSRLTGGRITAKLQPPEQRAQQKKSQDRPELGVGDGVLGQLKVEPGQPIDIVADALEVLDQRKTAQFTGSVNVKQGEFTMMTPSLTAFYSGQTGLMAVDGATSPATGSADLKKIEARNGVVLVAKDGRRVTGDWADFDPKSNFAIVGGRVVVTQGKNAVEGSKLIVDLTTGRSRFETGDGPPGKVAGKDTTSPVPCAPGQTCVQRGRVRAVFYPKDFSKKKDESSTSRRRSKSGDSGSTPAGQRPDASSWRSNTSPSGSQ